MLRAGSSSWSAARSSSVATPDFTAHTWVSIPGGCLRGAERATISFSQRSSSTRRTTVRAAVLRPVGR